MSVLEILIEFTDHSRINLHFPYLRPCRETAAASFMHLVLGRTLKLFEDPGAVNTPKRMRQFHVLDITDQWSLERFVDGCSSSETEGIPVLTKVAAGWVAIGV